MTVVISPWTTPLVFALMFEKLKPPTTLKSTLRPILPRLRPTCNSQPEAPLLFALSLAPSVVEL